MLEGSTFILDLERLSWEGKDEKKNASLKLASLYPKQILTLTTTFLGQQAGHFEYGRLCGSSPEYNFRIYNCMQIPKHIDGSSFDTKKDW